MAQLFPIGYRRKGKPRSSLYEDQRRVRNGRNAVDGPQAKCHTVSVQHYRDTMFLKLKPSAGQPLYLQLMDQIRHGIESGALRDGDQLPGIRTLAEELVVSPNTV